MWTFLNVRLKGFKGFPTEWMLKVTSLDQLLAYHMATTPNRIAAAFADGIKVREGRAHISNSLNILADMRAQRTGRSWVESLVNIRDEVQGNQQKLLIQGYILLIRSIGSYSFDNPDWTHYDVLETKQSEDMIWPKLEPRFLQWPGGSHWYAKVGDLDIEWNDKAKWDTRAEAERAAAKFLGHRR